MSILQCYTSLYNGRCISHLVEGMLASPPNFRLEIISRVTNFDVFGRAGNSDSIPFASRDGTALENEESISTMRLNLQVPQNLALT